MEEQQKEPKQTSVPAGAIIDLLIRHGVVTSAEVQMAAELVAARSENEILQQRLREGEGKDE